MNKHHLYRISGDGGESWTFQWLTYGEAEWHLKNGYKIQFVA